jgi:hypothetical protein
MNKIKYDTNLKAFVTWKVEILRKIEKMTFSKLYGIWKFQKIRECEHFQNMPTFWSSKTQIYMMTLITFAKTINPPIIEVRTSVFTGHLYLRRQRVKTLLPDPCQVTEQDGLRDNVSDLNSGGTKSNLGWNIVYRKLSLSLFSSARPEKLPR